MSYYTMSLIVDIGLITYLRLWQSLSMMLCCRLLL